MTYDKAMRALNEAIYDAVRAANNEDGAPVDALREIAADIDCLVDHGVTRAELRNMQLLYSAEKRAGLLKSKDELAAELRDAGRGHLVGR